MIIISIISFFLEGILSKYLFNTLFIPCLSICLIILMYPCFKNKYNYYIYCIILGFFYDILYMNMIFYNFFIFLFLGYITLYLYSLLSNNILITITIYFLLIILYRIINFLYLCLFNNHEFHFLYFLKSIYSSIFLNIIFICIIYIIMKKSNTIKICLTKRL